MASSLPALPLILVTLLVPPIGVLLLAGCGPDFAINVCLTVLGYIPGHIHAFYLLYVYYDRNRKTRQGTITSKRAPGIYSDEIQNGLSAVYDADDAGWRKPEVASNRESMGEWDREGDAPRFVGEEEERKAQWGRVIGREEKGDC